MAEGEARRWHAAQRHANHAVMAHEQERMNEPRHVTIVASSARQPPWQQRPF